MRRDSNSSVKREVELRRRERKAVSKKILTPPGSCLQQAQPEAAAAGVSQLEQTLSEIPQPHQGKSRKK